MPRTKEQVARPRRPAVQDEHELRLYFAYFLPKIPNEQGQQEQNPQEPHLFGKDVLKAAFWLLDHVTI